MFEWFSRLRNRGAVQATPAPLGRIAARYDAAQITDENKRHWAWADGLSARSANSPDVRQRLRKNSRYETANNSIANGMVQTLANDVVGTGPRLQMKLRSKPANQRIEALHRDWSAAIDFAGKLRTRRRARCVDGEGFAKLITNKRLPLPVKLDLSLIEAEMVTTPWLGQLDRNKVDGIDFDSDGNPVTYHILKDHPGDVGPLTLQAVPHDARYVLHSFRRDRPGQVRGIPEITPALPLFALRRRFMLATIMAAEGAANYTAILHTEHPGIGVPDDVPVFESFDQERNSYMAIPRGWDLKQLASEHPADTFEMFDRAIIREMSRCILMPYLIAAGDSSASNFASAQLDTLGYWSAIDIERDCDLAWDCSRIHREWLLEAEASGVIDIDGDEMERISRGECLWEWQWDAHRHIDVVKKENARQTRLQNFMASFDTEFAADGLDCETEWQKNADRLGITIEDYRRKVSEKLFAIPGQGNVADPETDDSEDSAKPSARKRSAVVPQRTAARNRVPAGGKA